MLDKQNLPKKPSLASEVSRRAHWILFLFIATQPILDILSYWLNITGLPPVAGLIRIFIILIVVVAGFTVSGKKRYFIVISVITILFFILRAFFNKNNGQPISFTDSLVFLRWSILPILLLGYINLLKTNSKSLKYTAAGIICSVLIIILSLALAAISDTMTYAYETQSLGVIGWFHNANAHSILLLALSLLSPMYGFLRKNNIQFYLAFIITFALLFMTGTRTAYFGAIIVGAIWLSALLITKTKQISHYIFIIILITGMGALYNLSPMSQNRQAIEGWRNSLNKQTTLKSQPTAVDNSTPKSRDKNTPTNKAGANAGNNTDTVKLYQRYVPHLLNSFGYEKTARALSYSSKPSVLVDHRVSKDAFAQLIFESGNVQNRIFGYSYDQLNLEGKLYEPERDISLVRVLFGYIGLATIAVFIALNLIVISISLKTRIIFRNPLVPVSILGFLLLLLLGIVSGHLLIRLNVAIYWLLLLAIPYALTFTSNTRSK